MSQNDSSPFPAYFAGNEAEELLAAEREYLRWERTRRRGGAAVPRTGIALSGGGIRAATFSLGVLQALAATDLLKKFDYLSSVSGGGYTAASLQWWWSKARREEDIATTGNAATYGTGRGDFPYGTGRSIDGQAASQDTKVQARNLAFLRSHGYYLIPGDGVSPWSAVSVIVRTILVSLLVWIPLTMFVFLVAQTFDDLVLQPWLGEKLRSHGMNIESLWSPLNSFMPYHWGSAVNHARCASLEILDRTRECVLSFRLIYALLLWLDVFAVALFIFGSIVFALLSRSADSKPDRGRLTFGSLRSGIGLVAVSGLIASIWYQFPPDAWQLGIKIVIGLLSLFAVTLFIRLIIEMLGSQALNWSYFFRRSLEIYFGKLLVPILCLLLVGLIPALPYYLALKGGEAGLTAGGAVTALFGLVSGSISALYGYYTVVRKIAPGLAGRIFAPVGSALYLYGTLTFGYLLAVFAFEALANHQSLLITEDLAGIAQVVVIGAIALAAIVGMTANINHIGLHRFYRDRLMEAFMPATEAVVRGKADFSPAADRLLLSDLISSFSRTSGIAVPFPIINTFATFTRDHDRTIARRGGENFVLTPLFVGSRATGWESTASHANRSSPITLASAMAASGAAVNSNAGYIGTGVTRDRLVSAAMTILNMRLGLWVANPAAYRRGVWRRGWLWRAPAYVHPMLTAGLLGFGHRRTSRFVELSDGGNFDNLGLYELARRKLSTIVVVDGESDSAIALPAFISAVKRIEEDFGATVSFVVDRGPERFVPVVVGESYPSGARYAESAFVVCQIRYADGSKGTIIYVKATLVRGLSFATRGYRAEHADFPHESTVDQFFKPDQFEAYRDLGFRSGMHMISALDLSKSIDKPEDVLSIYSKTCGVVKGSRCR